MSFIQRHRQALAGREQQDECAVARHLQKCHLSGPGPLALIDFRITAVSRPISGTRCRPARVPP
jgi:hypothetical protein